MCVSLRVEFFLSQINRGRCVLHSCQEKLEVSRNDCLYIYTRTEKSN